MVLKDPSIHNLLKEHYFVVAKLSSDGGVQVLLQSFDQTEAERAYDAIVRKEGSEENERDFFFLLNPEEQK